MSETMTMTGRQKAAVLMVAVPRQVAAAVFRYLSDPAVEQVTLEVANTAEIPMDQILCVVEEYYHTSRAKRLIPHGGVRKARAILEEALGSRPAMTVIQHLQDRLNEMPFTQVFDVDPAVLFSALQTEHPQIIALVLFYLEEDTASAILSRFPEDERKEIALRLADLGAPSPELVATVEQEMEKKLGHLSPGVLHPVEPVTYLAGVLRRLDETSQRDILGYIDQVNPQLTAKIQYAMHMTREMSPSLADPESVSSEESADLDEEFQRIDAEDNYLDGTSLTGEDETDEADGVDASEAANSGEEELHEVESRIRALAASPDCSDDDAARFRMYEAVKLQLKKNPEEGAAVLEEWLLSSNESAPEAYGRETEAFDGPADVEWDSVVGREEPALRDALLRGDARHRETVYLRSFRGSVEAEKVILESARRGNGHSAVMLLRANFFDTKPLSFLHRPDQVLILMAKHLAREYPQDGPVFVFARFLLQEYSFDLMNYLLSVLQDYLEVCILFPPGEGFPVLLDAERRCEYEGMESALPRPEPQREILQAVSRVASLFYLYRPTEAWEYLGFPYDPLLERESILFENWTQDPLIARAFLAQFMPVSEYKHLGMERVEQAIASGRLKPDAFDWSQCPGFLEDFLPELADRSPAVRRFLESVMSFQTPAGSFPSNQKEDVA